MRSRILIRYLLFLCVAVEGVGCQRLQKASLAPNLEQRVDYYLSPYIERALFNGAILIAENGNILMSKGYGMADYARQVPNTSRTRFRIASLSKPITDVAIAQFWEEGILEPGTTLDSFIPDFPQGDEITIQHLLGHQSGIAHLNSLPWYHQLEKYDFSLSELVRRLKEVPLDFDPGTNQEYSNGGYAILAYIIEHVSGLTYGEYLRDYVFEPLGMKDTGHEQHDVQVERLAVGYTPGVRLGDREEVGYVEMSLKIGGGSLYSTVEDLYLWDRAMVDSAFLQTATVERIFSSSSDGEFSYSGRAPGFNAVLERNASDNLTVIVLANNYASIVQKLTDDIEAIVRGQDYDPLAFNLDLEIDSVRLASYEGSYQWPPPFETRFEVRIGEQNTLIFSDETGARTVLIPVTTDQFILPLYGAAFTFVKSDDGHVSHIQNYFVGNSPETAFEIRRTGF